MPFSKYHFFTHDGVRRGRGYPSNFYAWKWEENGNKSTIAKDFKNFKASKDIL